MGMGEIVMKRMIVVLALMLLIVLPLSFGATISNPSQPGQDPGTVMKGVPFTISVSGLTGTGTAVINLPSGFTIDESTSKAFSSEAGTTSVSWTTIKANQKLSGQTISVTITTQSSSETLTTDAFDVILPPSLQATLSQDSFSLTSGEEATISINVQNWGETSAKEVVTSISLPEGCSLASGYSQSQSLGTILGGEGGSGETKGVSWRFSCSSSGSGSITVSASNADAITKTFSVTVTSAGAPGGGGPGGGVAPTNVTELKETRLISNLQPGVPYGFRVTKSGIGLKYINISVKNPAQNVKIIIKKLEGKPAEITHELGGKVYRYIEITTENLADENIENVTITFDVEKDWINENNIDKNTIRLYRYTTQWDPLTTTIIGENNTHITYQAISPGLSIFAIGSEQAVTTTTIMENMTTTVQPTPETTVPKEKKEEKEPISKPISWLWILIVIVIVGIIVVYVVYKRRQPEKYSFTSRTF